jgi:lysophospholipase L1-like esterase
MPQRNFSWRKLTLLAAIILFVAIVIGFSLARRSYENRLARQIWPVLASGILVVSNTPANFKSTVLLLGDSRIAQWELPQLAGWRVVNAGAGGLTTAQVLLAAPKLLDEFHPDAVVLQAGINDLKFIGLHPEQTSGIVSFAAHNLETVAYECAGRHCKVIVLETWPAGEPNLARRLVWSAEIPKAVDQLNDRLRSLKWREGGMLVVDLFAEAGLKPQDGLYGDTLHFKPEVYQRLTPFLEKELSTASSPAK